MMPFTSQKTESQRPPRFAAQALT